MHEQFPDMKQYYYYYDYAFQPKHFEYYFPTTNILIQIRREGKVTKKQLDALNKYNPDKDIEDIKRKTENFITNMELEKAIYNSSQKIIWYKMRATGGLGHTVAISGIRLTSYGWIQVICTAPESQYKIYENTFTKIIESVRPSRDTEYYDNILLFFGWNKVISGVISGLILGILGSIFRYLRQKRAMRHYPD